MSITQAQNTAIVSAGFTVTNLKSPAIMCATQPLETFSAPDWDSLALYAIKFQLCECENH